MQHTLQHQPAYSHQLSHILAMQVAQSNHEYEIYTSRSYTDICWIDSIPFVGPFHALPLLAFLYTEVLVIGARILPGTPRCVSRAPNPLILLPAPTVLRGVPALIVEKNSHWNASQVRCFGEFSGESMGQVPKADTTLQESRCSSARHWTNNERESCCPICWDDATENTLVSVDRHCTCNLFYRIQPLTLSWLHLTFPPHRHGSYNTCTRTKLHQTSINPG